MKIRVQMAAAALLAAGLGSGVSLGATVTARFSYSNLVVANVASPVFTGNVNTVSFDWTRTDTPGPGVDTTVPNRYRSFCVDLAQHVSSGRNYEYEVFAPEEIGWTPARTQAMQRLWADFLPQVHDGASSAAFQLAVWEIVYDTDRNLSTGSFRTGSPDASKSMAQNWLSSIDTTPTNRSLPTLRVLVHEGAQDQITEIPAPGPAACTILGLAMLGGRRKRREH
jgi:hypothetical protein